MNAFLVYSPNYDFYLPGLSALHPFDGRKYSHAWSIVQQRFGTGLDAFHLAVDDEVAVGDVLAIHTPDYIESLRTAEVVARALEIPAARFLPASALENAILRPMRLATQGTILAVKRALEGCVVFNLGGGYHHAFADHGEGFCIYADAAIALTRARNNQWLGSGHDVVIIDLDAHRGNGTEHIFRDDPHVHFFDMYNFQVYPGYLETDYKYLIPVPGLSEGAFYLDCLKTELPQFLASIPNPKLAIYNAGTDILMGDQLGGLRVKEDEARERDRYVLQTLTALGLPTVIVTSGGYSKHSAGLIADAATYLLGDIAAAAGFAREHPEVRK